MVRQVIKREDDEYLSILSDTEVLEIVMNLGNKDDFGDNYISEALQLSEELIALHRKKASTHIVKVNGTDSEIDQTILAGVYEDRLDLRELQVNGYLDEKNTSKYYRYALNWKLLSRNTKKRVLSNISNLDSRSYNIIENSGIALILFSEYREKGELSPILLSKFKEFSHFLIVYPPYIKSLSEGKQNSFFSLWLSAHANNISLNKKGSFLKDHLLRHFGRLKIIQETLGAKDNCDSRNTVKDNTVLTLGEVAPGLELFGKYISEKGLEELKNYSENIQGLYILGKQGIERSFSDNLEQIILDIDKLCLLLIGEEPEGKNALQSHTLLSILQGIKGKSNQEIKKEIEQYIRGKTEKKHHFSETIICAILTGVGGIDISKIYKDPEIKRLNLILPLLVPKFFQDQEDADTYFSWWFQQLDGEMKEDVENSSSDLWKYLKAHFFRIKVVEEKYQEISGPKLVEGINIPNQEELTMLFDIYSVSSGGAERSDYKDFLDSIGKIYGTEGLGSRFIEIFISTGVLHKNKDGAPRLLNIGSDGKFDPLDCYTKLGDSNIRAIERRRIKNLVLSTDPARIKEYTPLITLIAGRIVKHSHGEEIELKTLVKKYSLFILAYPVLLKTRNNEEQDNFFEIFFSYPIKFKELEEVNSPFWAYILKYFGDNPIVQGQYKDLVNQRGKLLSGISERFDSVWNKTVQLNGLTKAEAAERYKHTDILSSIDLEVSLTGNLKLGNEPELSEGKTLHIVIYERNQKGNNFRNPEFYTKDDITSGTVELDGPRYSYKAFAHRNTEAFATQKDLPDEVEAADPVFLKRKKREAPIPSKGSGNNKGSSVEETKETEKINLDLFIPDNVGIVEDRILLYFKENPEAGSDSDTVEYRIGKDGEVTLISYFGNTRHEINPEIDEIFRVAFDLDLAGELERRESLAAAKQEEIQRQKAKREETKREEKRKLERNERKKGREIFAKKHSFSEKILTYIDFFHATSLEERKTTMNGHEVFFWQVPPKDVILKSLEAICRKSGFTLSLKYGRTGFLEFITFKSDEYGAYECTTDSFSFNISDNNDNSIGREITRRLLELVIGVIFCENYVGSKKGVNITKKAAEYNKERKSARDSLIGKFKGDTKGDILFVDGWNYFGENIDKKCPEIHDHQLLGRRGSIRVGEREANEGTRYWQLKVIEEEFEMHDALVEYFYDRLQKNDFSNDKAKEIAAQYFKMLSKADYIDDKRNACLNISRIFSEAGLSVELIRPMGIDFHEIEGQL